MRLRGRILDRDGGEMDNASRTNRDQRRRADTDRKFDSPQRGRTGRGRGFNVYVHCRNPVEPCLAGALTFSRVSGGQTLAVDNW